MLQCFLSGCLEQRFGGVAWQVKSRDQERKRYFLFTGEIFIIFIWERSMARSQHTFGIWEQDKASVQKYGQMQGQVHCWQ